MPAVTLFLIVVDVAVATGSWDDTAHRPALSSNFQWPERRIAELFQAADSTRSTDLFHLDPVGRSLNSPIGPPVPLHGPLLDEPLRAPALAWALASDVMSASANPPGLIRLAAEQQGHPLDTRAALALIDATWKLADRPGALYDAIADFYDGGRRLSGNSRDELRRFAPRVPDQAARIAAFLLRCHSRALAWHKAAFDDARLPKERLDRRNFDRLALSWLDSLEVAPPVDADDAFRQAADGGDMTALLEEGLFLSMAVSRAAEMLDSLDSGNEADSTLHFIWDSPHGRIAIGGTGQQRFDGPHLLVLDLGGDDFYRGGGSAVFPDRPVALILDRSGNDAYAPADSASPGCAGAIGGVAVVADLAGNDHWQAWEVGLGAALFGVGLLWDRSGDDRYEAHAFSQGVAAWGMGILADNSGDDLLRLDHTGQGAGGPSGVGWLVDGAGADDYRVSRRLLDDGDAPSSEGRRGQGCGFGRPIGAGSTKGFASAGALAGGLGLLTDAGGNDRYAAGDLSQGAASNGGLGFLIEAGGDDRYDGRVASMGFGIYQGVGVLVEAAGSDSCRARGGCLGVGMQSGAGLYVDGEGNDQHVGIDSGFGVGHTGFGLYVDLAGDDEYPDSPTASGQASGEFGDSLRLGCWSTGLFLDWHGTDRYVGGTGYPRGGHDLMTNGRVRVSSDPSSVGTRRVPCIGIAIDTE